MRFQCTFCNFLVEADEDDKGKTAQCPSCENTIIIPAGPFEEGCVIGDFVIKEKIGSGSIGTVYKAEQISLGRTVALKILSPQYTNRAGVKSFLKEARAAALLSHPNLVQSLAVGSEGKVCFMAMNYIRGETVKDIILRDGPFEEDEALHWIQQVAEALHYAWTDAGLVHRDVKPENMMINDEGIVKLTDLGLAIPLSEWKEGMKISGSPSYMSPEQFTGKKIDCRSDIYSLGVSLYQMLSGDLPFKGETLRTVAQQHFNDVPLPLHKLNTKVSSKVSRLVMKMMSKKPENRFVDMDDLLHNIWQIRQETAPNKELVPEVHTISINRLDYSQQIKTLKSRLNKEDSSMAEVKELKNLNKTLGILFGILTAVIVLFVIAWEIISYQEPNPNYDIILQETRELKLEAAEQNLDPDMVKKRADELIGRLADPQSSEEEILRLELQLIVYQAEVGKLRQQIGRMGRNQKSTER